MFTENSTKVDQHGKERQTILSQVYSIHQQPIKLSMHQIINIAKTPNDYFIITQEIWTFEASCEHKEISSSNNTLKLEQKQVDMIAET